MGLTRGSVTESPPRAPLQGPCHDHQPRDGLARRHFCTRVTWQLCHTPRTLLLCPQTSLARCVAEGCKTPCKAPTRNRRTLQKMWRQMWRRLLRLLRSSCLCTQFSHSRSRRRHLRSVTSTRPGHAQTTTASSSALMPPRIRQAAGRPATRRQAPPSQVLRCPPGLREGLPAGGAHCGGWLCCAVTHRAASHSDVDDDDDEAPARVVPAPEPEVRALCSKHRQVLSRRFRYPRPCCRRLSRPTKFVWPAPYCLLLAR